MLVCIQADDYPFAISTIGPWMRATTPKTLQVFVFCSRLCGIIAACVLVHCLLVKAWKGRSDRGSLIELLTAIKIGLICRQQWCLK